MEYLVWKVATKNEESTVAFYCRGLVKQVGILVCLVLALCMLLRCFLWCLWLDVGNAAFVTSSAS